jgi:Amt family ammonium transporter
LIGLAAGVLVVFSVVFFDKIKIDDPVGALSVHLVNGIFGTLALGLFADKGIASKRGTVAESLSHGLCLGGGFHQLGVQLLGVVSVGAFVFAMALIGWFILKLVTGIRVSREEELMGLDIGEHGMEAYSGFQVFTNT